MAGEKLPVQIRTRKFIRNVLLNRRQFVSFKNTYGVAWITNLYYVNQ